MILFLRFALLKSVLRTPARIKAPQSYKIINIKAIGARIMREIKFTITERQPATRFKTKKIATRSCTLITTPCRPNYQDKARVLQISTDAANATNPAQPSPARMSK